MKPPHEPRGYVHIAFLIVTVVLVVTMVSIWQEVRTYQFPQTSTGPLGGDRDAYGCIPSAGYSWCEAKQKCLRVWEEACVAETNTNAVTNTNLSTNEGSAASTYCVSDSDCGLLVCNGCFSNDYLRTAPPDPACRTYEDYTCECRGNVCTPVIKAETQ